MFFLNQDIKYVILDYPSIELIDDCLSALEKSIEQFEKLYILHWDGRTKTIEKIKKQFPKLLPKLIVFPKVEEKFGWLVAPIGDLLNSEKISPLDCVFISENEVNLTSAQTKPIGTVTFSSALPQTLARIGTDMIVSSWTDLSRVISGEIVGLWGEIEMAPQEVFIKKHEQYMAGSLLKIPNDLLPQVPIYYGGRYLSKTKDQSSLRHLYTLQILHSKSNPAVQGPRFTDTLKTLIDFIIRTEGVDPLITYVPKKPSDERDRLGVFLNDLSQKYRQVLCLLNCVKDYGKQSGAGNRAQRAENVKDAFRVISTASVTGKEIVLFDDIGTTFSTVNECAKTLLKAGAKKVIILCLGITCDPSDIVLGKIQCKDCQNTFALRFNNSKGTPFWACGGYPRCKNTFTYMQGVSSLRSLDRSDIPF